MISMTQTWDRAFAFLRREAALLVPLALATIYLGDVVTGLATEFATGQSPSGLATVAIVAISLWSIVGQLAVVALVLEPGRSVGEALMHGGRRLGKVILCALPPGLIFACAAVALASVATAYGFDVRKPETAQALPGWVALLSLAGVGVFVWLAIRLALMNALIVDRNPSVIAALTQAFAITRGIGARLFLIAAIYGVVVIVVGSAVQFVAGSLFALVGAATGSPFAGTVLTALVAGLVTAALSLTATVFLATLYKEARR